MSRLPAYDPFRIHHQRTDGLQRPEGPYDEPGTWQDNTDKQSISGVMSVITQITDAQLTGNDPSTGTWRLTITPLLDQYGNAASNGSGPAYVEFAATVDDLDDVNLGLIAAAATGAGISEPEDLAAWSRLLSYVTLSVSPTGNAYLRVTAKQSGLTFTVTITAPAGNSYALTAVATPGTDVISVGTYVAHDTDITSGYNPMGQPYLELITSGTAAADFLGPVMLSENMEALDPGDLYQTIAAGKCASLAVYGHPRVYGETAIPVASIGTRVYVRRSASGNLVAGTATDATGAAAGATADVWTGTPTAVNDTEYIFEIAFQGAVVQITVLSDASATATEISDAARLEIAKYNATVGQPLYGITASGTSTIVLTGPSDGRSFTPSQVAASAGTIAWVHTTTGVATHYLHPRGDTFLAASPGPGSVPIAIPHP